ncbi:hypothetical protein PV326_001544, partial [Microctonus aethiopoides]
IRRSLKRTISQPAKGGSTSRTKMLAHVENYDAGNIIKIKRGRKAKTHLEFADIVAESRFALEAYFVSKIIRITFLCLSPRAIRLVQRASMLYCKAPNSQSYYNIQLIIT